LDYYLGIDVSKGYADFCLLSGEGEVLSEEVFDDTAAGHESLRKLIEQCSEEADGSAFEVGLEATGGLERNWLQTLRRLTKSHDLETFLVNPLAVKRFMEQALHTGKTDQISARAIARYMRRGLRPEDEVPFEEHLEGAKAVVRMIRSIVREGADLRNRFQNLMQRVHPELVQYGRSRLPKWLLRLVSQYPTAPQLATASCEEVATIPFVTAERACALTEAAAESVASQQDGDTAFVMAYMAEKLLDLMEETNQLKERAWQMIAEDEGARILTSIPGISEWAATALRVEIGPIHRFASAKKLVAYVGLDPQIEQSGDRRTEKSISKRGNPRIRALLYACVRCAVQHNPPIRAFYHRLRERGKHHMVAMTACMRKLLCIIYGCWIKGERFDPAFEKRLKQCRAKRTSAQESGAAEGSAAPCLSLAAPISRKEAKRRREAALPQKGAGPSMRGQGMASLDEP
jgi:transposase